MTDSSIDNRLTEIEGRLSMLRFSEISFELVLGIVLVALIIGGCLYGAYYNYDAWHQREAALREACIKAGKSVIAMRGPEHHCLPVSETK